MSSTPYPQSRSRHTALIALTLALVVYVPFAIVAQDANSLAPDHT